MTHESIDLRLAEEAVDDPAPAPALGPVRPVCNLFINIVDYDVYDDHSFDSFVERLRSMNPRPTVRLHFHVVYSAAGPPPALLPPPAGVPEPMPAANASPECRICFKTEANMKLPCEHRFCDECIRPWLVARKKCGVSYCLQPAKVKDLKPL